MAWTIACRWITTSPPTQLILWQPSRRSVHAIAASARGSVSSPLSLSVLMSPFWQKAHRMLHEALRAAIEQLLPGMMEMRADPRTRGKLASAELGARHPVDVAIPGAKIAVGEHAVGKFAAQLQQARTVCRLRQWLARPDRLPARDEYRREALELDPQRVLAACRRIKPRGDRCGDAELGWTSVLRNVQVPR